jgi:hypothetical protein
MTMRNRRRLHKEASEAELIVTDTASNDNIPHVLQPLFSELFSAGFSYMGSFTSQFQTARNPFVGKETFVFSDSTRAVLALCSVYAGPWGRLHTSYEDGAQVSSHYRIPWWIMLYKPKSPNIKRERTNKGLIDGLSRHLVWIEEYKQKHGAPIQFTSMNDIVAHYSAQLRQINPTPILVRSTFFSIAMFGIILAIRVWAIYANLSSPGLFLYFSIFDAVVLLSGIGYLLVNLLLLSRQRTVVPTAPVRDEQD